MKYMWWALEEFLKLSNFEKPLSLFGKLTRKKGDVRLSLAMCYLDFISKTFIRLMLLYALSPPISTWLGLFDLKMILISIIIFPTFRDLNTIYSLLTTYLSLSICEASSG